MSERTGRQPRRRGTSRTPSGLPRQNQLPPRLQRQQQQRQQQQRQQRRQPQQQQQAQPTLEEQFKEIKWNITTCRGYCNTNIKLHLTDGISQNFYDKFTDYINKPDLSFDFLDVSDESYSKTQINGFINVLKKFNFKRESKIFIYDTMNIISRNRGRLDSNSFLERNGDFSNTHSNRRNQTISGDNRKRNQMTNLDNLIKICENQLQNANQDILHIFLIQNHFAGSKFKSIHPNLDFSNPNTIVFHNNAIYILTENRSEMDDYLCVLLSMYFLSHQGIKETYCFTKDNYRWLNQVIYYNEKANPIKKVIQKGDFKTSIKKDKISDLRQLCFREQTAGTKRVKKTKKVKKTIKRKNKITKKIKSKK